MAIYNEILSARFSRLAQRLFGMKGPQAIKQIAGDLPLMQPLPFGPEHRYLLEEQRFGMDTATLTGAAGQFPGFRMRNPANSNFVAVVEKILLRAGAANGFNVDLSSVALDLTGSALVSQRMDGRIGNRRSALTVTSQLTLAAVITPTIASTVVSANNTAIDLIITNHQELPILPGDALSIGGTIAAGAIAATVWWRERALEASELSS